MTGPDRLRLRDALVALLSVRKGSLITDELIRDRSSNGTFYLEELVDDFIAVALRDAARGEVITGSLHDEGDTVLGTVRPPEAKPTDPNQCPRSRWCADVPGHEGDCLPPF